MEEILNIEYHTNRLILKALNKHKSVMRASKVLQVSERKLFRMIKDGKIIKTNGVYSMPEFPNNDKNYITPIETTRS